MRGKGCRLFTLGVRAGITPAYAGKSLKLISCFFVDQDHPRLCGEKVKSDSCGSASRGSPPPMRGKAITPFCNKSPCRITPAYAGKRIILTDNQMFCRDHPRLCGEKGSNGCSFPVLIGSPPPMRGKARLSGSCRARARITPAYAGKSTVLAERHNGIEDHPRLCGEKW